MKTRVAFVKDPIWGAMSKDAPFCSPFSRGAKCRGYATVLGGFKPLILHQSTKQAKCNPNIRIKKN